VTIEPKRLRARLKAAGLTPEQADHRGNLAHGTTAELLRGTGRRVHSDELAMLCMALDCLVQELVDARHDTDADRAFALAGNSLTQADAGLLLAAVYRTVNEDAREELRRAAQAIVHRVA
jgi:DNA-binding Xre family transcriptional regulator